MLIEKRIRKMIPHATSQASSDSSSRLQRAQVSPQRSTAATAWVANRIRASAGIDTGAIGAIPLALTILTLTAIHLLGDAEILGAWCAGLGFANVPDHELREQAQRPQQAVEALALVLAFILFGVALPFAEWSSFGRPLAFASGSCCSAARPSFLSHWRERLATAEEPLSWPRSGRSAPPLTEQRAS